MHVKTRIKENRPEFKFPSLARGLGEGRDEDSFLCRSII